MTGFKIAYFVPSTSWGGLEMNQLRNASWMKNRGHQVIAFVQENSRAHQEAIQLDIPVEFVKYHRKYYDLVKAYRLSKLLKKHEVAYMFVRDPKDMSVCALAKTFSGNRIKLIYFMEMQLGIPKRDFLHTLRFNRFDLWSCPLPWLKKQVAELTRFPERKTLLIPSGLELGKYGKMKTKVAKEELELNPENEYIGLVGRLHPLKGQLLLLQAFNEIKNETNHHVLLLGEPTIGESTEFVDELHRFIQENDLENRVHLRPFRRDVEVFYDAIDVFVMATKKETFGMVTVEALAAGCKIVGSNQGGTVEILENGKFGHLFDADDYHDLAEKLILSIKDESFDKSVQKQAALTYDSNHVCKMVEEVVIA